MQPIDALAFATRTFGHARLGHAARTKRAVRIVAAMAAKPTESLPRIFSEAAELKAAYRFFNQDEIAVRAMIDAMALQSATCCTGRKTVLLITDSSSLNFGIRKNEGLGSIGKTKAVGMFFQSVLAVDAHSSEVLGVVAQRTWVRTELKSSSAEHSRDRRLRERESAHWKNSFSEAVDVMRGSLEHPPQLVFITDREGDFYELFSHAQRLDVDFIIRVAQLNRRLDPESSDGANNIRSALDVAPVMVRSTVDVPSGPGRAARQAKVEIRSAAVSIRPPLGQIEGNPIDFNVVEVSEIDAPEGGSPLHWCLATSEAVDTVSAVLRVVSRYRKRWLIEELHMAIKTGTALESRQLHERSALERLLVVSTSIAVELLRLREQAQLTTKVLAVDVLGETKMKVLRALRPKMPADPTLREAMRWIANLGGFLMRKREPGWRTLWLGYSDILKAERLLLSLGSSGQP